MAAANIYAAHALAQMPRLLGMLDREPHSASYGSADREHWSWKFRDFPQGMLQSAAVPLALAWRHKFPDNPYFRNPQVLEWICGILRQTMRRQHANGAWDAFFPNERDPAVTLGVLCGLLETCRVLADDLPPALREQVAAAARPGLRFAASGDENHAFISNHWALFALTWLNAHELFGGYLPRAETCIERILKEQSHEGWYREYQGADPGYESLGISYLAAYWQRTRDARLLESLRRAVDFYAHCVHPDGSIGGVYGSRHTSQYFPAGFELLRTEIPAAAAVADFMQHALERGNVLTPASCDPENLPPVLINYLHAARTAERLNTQPLPLLPCQALDGVRHFAASGIIIAGTPRYYAVASSTKGGVCRIFDKATRSLVYEDAGYLAETPRGRWASQLISEGAGAQSKTAVDIPAAQPAEVICQAQFARSTQRLPTPWNYWVFRALSLTAFRSRVLGNWLRRMMVRQLVTQKSAGPLRLRRVFRFEREAIFVLDRVERTGPEKVNAMALPRSFTAIHMGSAKYFHPAELLPLRQPDVSGMAAELNRSGAAERSWSLQWDAQGQCAFREGIQQQKSQEVEIGVPR